ncbi:hypothetical protein GCM10009777_23540 [Microbacterium pumilum]|uniref:DUF3099 domain-containing protein n=2 Tax=Microbacterium pumilum TaxID=344165 RepID=A0ABP5E1R8_9MICO
MMGIRVACFILMVVITPYGWYTWVFGAAAIFIPYVAVVLANVSSNVRTTDVERPELAISAEAHEDPTADPEVVRVDEIRAVAPLDDPDPRA